MSKSDEPITTLSNLKIIADPNSGINGLYTPQVTPEELAAITLTTDKVGGILFNLQREELQYLAPTLQWVDITTDGGEPVFTSVTVATDAIVLGTIWGNRPTGALFCTAIPTFTSGIDIPIKIPGTTTSGVLNKFTMSANNRLTYTAIEDSPINVLVNGTFSSNFSQSTTIYLVMALNGSAIGVTSTARDVAAGVGFQLSLSTVAQVSTNDYIELWTVSLVGGSFSATAAATNTMALVVTQV